MDYKKHSKEITESRNRFKVFKRTPPGEPDMIPLTNADIKAFEKSAKGSRFLIPNDRDNRRTRREPLQKNYRKEHRMQKAAHDLMKAVEASKAKKNRMRLLMEWLRKIFKFIA